MDCLCLICFLYQNEVYYLYVKKSQAKGIRSMYTTRKSLLKRLQKNDDISWEEFYRIYWPLVQAVGGKVGLPQDDCKDLMQEIMLDLFKGEKIMHYDASRGKFRTFFGVLIRHKASEMLRALARQSAVFNTDDLSPKDDSSLPQPTPGQNVEDTEDPFSKLFDEEYRKCLLAVALDELRNNVAPKTYTIFEMVVLQERPPKEVALHIGISRALIDAYCSRCRKALRRIIFEIRTDNPDFTIDVPL